MQTIDFQKKISLEIFLLREIKNFTIELHTDDNDYGFLKNRILETFTTFVLYETRAYTNEKLTPEYILKLWENFKQKFI